MCEGVVLSLCARARVCVGGGSVCVCVKERENDCGKVCEIDRAVKSKSDREKGLEYILLFCCICGLTPFSATLMTSTLSLSLYLSLSITHSFFFDIG